MGVLNIVNIETQLKSILDTANTTTASNDLSSNLSSRVKGVFRLNPEKFPIQLSQYPCVTVYTSGKSEIEGSIAASQAASRRTAILNLNVASIVFNNNLSSTDYDDPASDDLIRLTENVENILRSNTDINNTVTWNMPSSVDYFTVAYDEQVHMRASVINIGCKVYY